MPTFKPIDREKFLKNNYFGGPAIKEMARGLLAEIGDYPVDGRLVHVLLNEQCFTLAAAAKKYKRVKTWATIVPNCSKLTAERISNLLYAKLGTRLDP